MTNAPPAASLASLAPLLAGLLLPGMPAAAEPDLPAPLADALQQPDTTTRLDLRNQNLSELPPALFELTELEVLHLSGNPLETLPPRIGELHNLRELTLGDEARTLTSLPRTLGDLSRLEKLHIWRHDIRRLPETLTRCTALKFLMVAGGKTVGVRHELPEDLSDRGIVGRGGGLYHVYGGLAELPQDIGALTNLTEFVITYHQVRHLPRSIGKLVHLESFRVEHGALTNLPASFGNLESLRSARLNDNPALAALPASIGNLTRLEELSNAHNDSMKTLPPEIGRLRRLRLLVQSNMALESLPETIGALQNLQVFRFAGHELSRLPEAIGTLDSLRVLHLDARGLQTLPDLGGLSQLELLDLTSLPIETLPPDLDQLTSLRILRLHNLTAARPAGGYDAGRWPQLKAASLDARFDDLVGEDVLRLEDRTHWRSFAGAVGFGAAHPHGAGTFLLRTRPLPAPLPWTESHTLDLTCTDLPALGPPPERIRRLRSLTLSYNYLVNLDRREDWRDVSVLQDWLRQAAHLERLDLSVNLMERLPPSVLACTGVRELKLDSNLLTEIPEAVAGLKELRRLDLSGNRLRRLPASLAELPSLQWLDLRGNPLSKDWKARIRGWLPETEVLF